jgi:hypothetical protein
MAWPIEAFSEFNDRGIGRHFHGLRGGADLELEIDHRMFACSDVQPFADGFGKAGRLHRDVVIAGKQEQGAVFSRSIGNGIVVRPGVDLGNGDFGSGNETAGRVSNGATDATAKFLSENAARKQGGGEKDCGYSDKAVRHEFNLI